TRDVHLLTPAAVAAAREERPAPAEAGRGGGISRVCICSPTGHPGSFRCRHHRGDYRWGN
ncbi:hypothetical protein M569_03923, partial [Genlisea aurea]